MEAEGLPPPEAYNIGNQKITFLSNPELSLSHQGFIYRDQVITEIQDALIKNREKIVCLIGDSGVGKSALCQYLASDKIKTILIKIPARANKEFDPVEYLIFRTARVVRLRFFFQ
jgi:ABC-type nitrate/sulfonate/bicarbonate transport system ATPase subunit